MDYFFFFVIYALKKWFFETKSNIKREKICWWKSIGSLNVRQLFISLPFLLPSNRKRKEEKENEVAKPVLNHFFHYPIDFHRFVSLYIPFFLPDYPSFLKCYKRYRKVCLEKENESMRKISNMFCTVEEYHYWSTQNTK